MLRFAGFEVDQRRSELRGPDGGTIKLRPKAFDLLWLFAANPRRIISKNELMEAVWPDVHVSDDSLFQCIRELRTALGDDRRQLIRAVSGRGYLLEAEVSDTTDTTARKDAASTVGPETESELAGSWLDLKMRRRAALLTMAGLGVSALAAAATRLSHLFAGSRPTVAVIPVTTASNDPLAARMAAGVTRDLTDGLAKIETIQVVIPPGGAVPATDLVVSSELEKTEAAWNLRVRMTEPTTGAVKWTTSVSVGLTDTDVQLQQTRLTAGMGHALALRINVLLNSGERAADGLPAGSTKVAIEQATASINQTTLERFRAAQAMLEQALADDAGNVDLQVALAAFQLRGIQMAWFPAAERVSVENRVGVVMERALRAQPNYIPVLQTHCRFLSTTNRFVESLVACGKVLALNPWDGSALYLTGLSQIFLGRFDDALATFKQADRFDTPQVARWTWAIGAGLACLLMGRAEEALPWLQRSIAITSASGRTHLLLAAAYQQLGRTDDARAAIAKALELRPGSTARNAPPPTRNTSPVYLKASERVVSLMIAAGLPES
ncbi:winged helix-turn-helix domain-containing protein [Bosea sp. TAB14]|uniref:winged helix-turn-helix domain-containing protein n=1 Tax=Bosea sp. TAB14 TaxID=3237481 RepID=UPI003F8E5A5C